MSFTRGLAGLVGGLFVLMVAGLFFASAQYAYPAQAAFWMWVGTLGLVVMIFGPVWYWIGQPLSRHVSKARKA